MSVVITCAHIEPVSEGGVIEDAILEALGDDEIERIIDNDNKSNMKIKKKIINLDHVRETSISSKSIDGSPEGYRYKLKIYTTTDVYLLEWLNVDYNTVAEMSATHETWFGFKPKAVDPTGTIQLHPNVFTNKSKLKAPPVPDQLTSI